MPWSSRLSKLLMSNMVLDTVVRVWWWSLEGFGWALMCSSQTKPVYQILSHMRATNTSHGKAYKSDTNNMNDGTFSTLVDMRHLSRINSTLFVEK
jgi:hypothetical protein